MITLCVIARNEGRHLPRLLASVTGWVDQIVLVDTGSTDDTVAIAEAAGVTVLHHTWSDHFGEARNVALAAVSEGWVLQLDADEALAPGAGHALRVAVARNEARRTWDGAVLPLHNATSADEPPARTLAAPAQPLLRLFPVGVRMEGRIHESPTSWLQGGARLARIDVHILHYGYLSARVEAAGKQDRNLNLLQRCWREDGPSPVIGGYLAYELLKRGRQNEASEVLALAWAALHAQIDAAPARITLATLYLQDLLRQGRALEALTEIEWLRPHTLAHPNLDWLEARVRAELGGPGQWERAEALLRTALTKHPNDFAESALDGVTGRESRALLGEVLLHQGRVKEAAAALAQAEAEGLVAETLSLARLECRILEGDVVRVLEELYPALGATARPDHWFLAALGCHHSGVPNAPVAFVKRALTGHFVGVGRRERLRALVREFAVLAGQPIRD